jgi:hypothetical protein
MSEQTMATGIVADGRVLDVGDGGVPGVAVRPGRAFRASRFWPGETVTLPADEFARLVHLGVLIDPSKQTAVVDNGVTRKV